MYLRILNEDNEFDSTMESAYDEIRPSIEEVLNRNGNSSCNVMFEVLPKENAIETNDNKIILVLYNCKNHPLYQKYGRDIFEQGNIEEEYNKLYNELEQAINTSSYGHCEYIGDWDTGCFALYLN